MQEATLAHNHRGTDEDPHKTGTKPYCCKKPTMVPLNFRTQVKADLEADVMKGILERVPDGEPTHGALD